MGSRTTSIALAMLMLTGTLIVPALADDPESLPSDPFEEFDATVSDLLDDWDIPGAQVAVMHNGSLVFNKGYGISANGTNQGGDYWSSNVTVDSKFRIASLSKAVTSAGILTLIPTPSVTSTSHIFSITVLDSTPHLTLPIGTGIAGLLAGRTIRASTRTR